MNTVKNLRTQAGLTQEELAYKLGVSPQTVWGWENGKFSPKGKRLRDLAQFFNVLEAEIVSPTQKKQVPVLGHVSAGIPLEAITDILDYEDIPQDWQGDYFALQIRGDSMSPKYLDGDVVIVRVQPTCDNGQDAVVQVNGFDATLKTVYIAQDHIELHSINPKYQPMKFKNVQIMGVAVELRRKI